jgi:hypothetical protein
MSSPAPKNTTFVTAVPSSIGIVFPDRLAINGLLTNDF